MELVVETNLMGFRESFPLWFLFFLSFKAKKKKRVWTEARSQRKRLPSLPSRQLNENKVIDTIRFGDVSSLLETKSVKMTWTHLLDFTLCCSLLIKLRKMKTGKFMGNLWSMTNTTFPVFLMDNIRVWSHGKETPVLSASQRHRLSENWLSQCTSFSFFLFVWIKFNQWYS